jgi:hypothetical protein
MPQKHARYSPSKLSALEKCPCFESDNELRRSRDLEASDEGTLLHDAMEHDCPLNLESEEQVWAYDVCQAKIAEIIASCPGRYRDLREVRSRVRELTYGFADRVIVDYVRKIIHVVDYKFGRTAVDHAEFNLQLHAYGVGLLERFTSFQALHLHLIAPRIPDFTTAQFSRDLVDVTRARIENIISEAASPFKQPSGGEHCAFCTNKPQCPVVCKAVADVARGAGYFDLPVKFTPENIVTPEDRTKAMLLARVLPDWCQMVKQMNTVAVLEYGEEIPGFSLRRRAGSVSIKDQTYVYQKIAEAFGWTGEEMILNGTAKLSISKLADLMREEYPVEEFNTKRDYTDALVEMLGDAVARGEEVIFLQKDRKPTDAELLAQVSN